MGQLSPQFQWRELLQDLKPIAAIAIFLFTLGVGYQSQRLESELIAEDVATNERISQHVKQGDIDREYIQRDLAEIKLQLADIQRYLREHK